MHLLTIVSGDFCEKGVQEQHYYKHSVMSLKRGLIGITALLSSKHICMTGQNPLNIEAEDAYINKWVLTLVLGLRTMRIISPHPPPLACSGLSDKLSSSALFALCFCMVTNGTNKTVCVGEQHRFKTKCHTAVHYIILAIGSHLNSQAGAICIESTYTGINTSDTELLHALWPLSVLFNGTLSPFTSNIQC